MRVIWKWRLSSRGRTTIEMPKGAVILCAQPQHDTVTIWAIVDPKAPEEDHRTFFAALTGTPLENPDKLQYIATVQLQSGAFVAHLFEEVPR